MSYLVKNYMRRDIVTADVETSVFEASKIVAEKDVGYLLVLENGVPAGIVTVGDLAAKVTAKAKDPLKVKISEIMPSPLITIDPDATIEDAVETMVKYGIRTLAVVRDSILYGTFGARDLARHFNEYVERVAKDIVKNMARISLPFWELSPAYPASSHGINCRFYRKRSMDTFYPIYMKLCFMNNYLGII